MSRRNLVVYGLLAGVWGLVFVWQLEEHARVREAAKTDLRYRAKDIARSVGACIRAGVFWGGVSEERLETALDELISGQTNDPAHPTELISVALLNAAGVKIFSAGRPVDLEQQDLLQQGERWGLHTVTLINPVDLGAVLLPRRPDYTTNRPAEIGRDFPRHPPEPGPPGSTNFAGAPPGPPPPGGPPPDGREGRRSRGRRRDLSEEERERQSLHGLVLTMSTESLQAASLHDLWLRGAIMLFAGISVLGYGLSWRNFSKNADLQIRLVRASELNTHLKEMNLAAAGLAHETRNPLNIIRGLAQMISKRGETDEETKGKARDIVDEADTVAAQLNEFINYSRPREVRRTRLALSSVVSEVVRALNYDIEEKKIKLEVKGEQFNLEADEQMLRQALFNLLLNAVQAVGTGGEIEVVPERRNGAEGVLEIRDNGPGVRPENRTEIFKPYFTTQKTGTGLGLAVVQQIVQAHGWEIECLANEPQGAVFRINHLQLAN